MWGDDLPHGGERLHGDFLCGWYSFPVNFGDPNPRDLSCTALKLISVGAVLKDIHNGFYGALAVTDDGRVDEGTKGQDIGRCQWSTQQHRRIVRASLVALYRYTAKLEEFEEARDIEVVGDGKGEQVEFGERAPRFQRSRLQPALSVCLDVLREDDAFA